MIIEGVYPLNSSTFDPNIRGEAPEVMEVHRDEVFGAMVAGVKTTTFKSAIGKGKGEVWGVQLLNTQAATNKALTAKAVQSSTDDSVDVTIQSTDATATDNLTLSFILFGRILPVDAS